MPAMLFTLPRGCPQAPFRLHFGFILGAFWALWALKAGPGSKKDAPRKSIKKRSPKLMSRALESDSKRGVPVVTLGTFFASRGPFPPESAVGPILAPFYMEN
jgi:hypothetical protein